MERDTLAESLKKARSDLARQMASAADSIDKLQTHTEAVTSDLEHRYHHLHSEGSNVGYQNDLLKLTFGKYPAIHTNYIIFQCTTLPYNQNNYMTQYLGRNKILNTKSNEFNSVAISLLSHEPPMLCSGLVNVAGIRRR